MNISEINPDAQLKSLLEGKVYVQISAEDSRLVQVYKQGERPNIEIPEEYLEILQNGPIRSKTLQMGVLEGALALAVSIKSNDDGTVKLNRLNSVIRQIEGLVGNQSSESFFFYFNTDNIITAPSVNLTSGYSTAILNVMWHTKG